MTVVRFPESAPSIRPRAGPVLRTAASSPSAGRRLAEHVKRTTAEQRLAALLAHSQLLTQFARAGGAIVPLQPRDTTAVRQALVAAGFQATAMTGDADDPIPALPQVADAHGNRADLLLGLRGMDPELLGRPHQVTLADAALEIVGRKDFIAMQACTGGPIDLADARALIEQDAGSLDLDLLRRLARRFGRDAQRAVAKLLGDTD